MTPQDIPSSAEEITDLHLEIARCVNSIVAGQIEENEPYATNQIRALNDAADALIGSRRKVLYITDDDTDR